MRAMATAMIYPQPEKGSKDKTSKAIEAKGLARDGWRNRPKRDEDAALLRWPYL
jgi:hypothetical protein